MSDEVVIFRDAAEQFERDTKAWDMAMAYVRPQKIAQRLSMSVEEVHASIARMSGGVTPDFRSREMQMILEQIRELQAAFHLKAKDGDYDSAVIQLRSLDLRARMLGLFAPPMRDDPLDEIKTHPQSSTERIHSVLDELCGENHMIEGEVVKDQPPDDG